LQQPATSVEHIGHVDAVLLSHEHHHDHLDKAGRRMLASVSTVFNTVLGAEGREVLRLGRLKNWLALMDES